MIERITLPVLVSILHHELHDDIYLDEKSFALLLDIQRVLSVFEPFNDDEARIIWLEIPRGTAEELNAFFEARHEVYDYDLDSCKIILEEDFPYEKEWFFLVTSTYHEHTFLKISDRVHRFVIFSNRNLGERAHPRDMVWFLEPLRDMVVGLVTDILKDPDSYNLHVKEDLPYHQRFGVIKSRDLCRIIPERRVKLKDRKYCIDVLKDLLRRKQVYESVKSNTSPNWDELGVPAPLDTMTIRTFCRYYRIADFACLSYPQKKRKRSTTLDGDDVKYYKRGFHQALVDYDLDSEEDFRRFAKDHYGEIGLSRMNVGATRYYAGGKWLITFGISYSAHDLMGLEIALALYETGAPFIFYDAQNLIHILENTGTVRITPFTFHDYLRGGDDEGAISLPFKENCGKEGELTLTQYEEIVRLAEWEPEEELKLDSPIPLDDEVYDLIREEVNTPLTLSDIRHIIENKYNTYLSVYEEDRTGYYYILPDKHTEKSEDRFPTFNMAIRALILKMKGNKNRKSHSKNTKMVNPKDRIADILPKEEHD